MALRLKPAPTFRAKVSIPDPAGEPFDVDCEFRHMGRAEFEKFTQENKGKSDVETVRAILVKWHDAVPYSDEALAQVLDAYPGAAFAISEAYGRALFQGRRGN